MPSVKTIRQSSREGEDGAGEAWLPQPDHMNSRFSFKHVGIAAGILTDRDRLPVDFGLQQLDLPPQGTILFFF